MIIKVILIAGLMGCLAYAFLQRHKSRRISIVIGAVSVAGSLFVLFPAQTDVVAAIVGVGRGADLILYCWQVIGLMILINLQFRILTLQGMITDLARELTLLAARVTPPTGEARLPPDDRSA